MSVNPFTGDIYLGIMSISYLSTQCPSPSTPCPVLLLAPLSLSPVSDTRPLLFFVTKPTAHVIVAAIPPSFAPTLSDGFPLLAAVVATPLVPLLPPRLRRHCHPAHAATTTLFRAVTATPLVLSLAQRVPYLPCVATCLADITAHGCLECGSCGSSVGGEVVGWVLRTGRR